MATDERLQVLGARFGIRLFKHSRAQCGKQVSFFRAQDFQMRLRGIVREANGGLGVRGERSEVECRSSRRVDVLTSSDLFERRARGPDSSEAQEFQSALESFWCSDRSGRSRRHLPIEAQP